MAGGGSGGSANFTPFRPGAANEDAEKVPASFDTSGNRAGALSAEPPDILPQMIIRTANITAEADDVSKTTAEITRVAQSFGGYVLGSTSQSSEGTRESVDITLKVPADRFFPAIEKVKSLCETIFSVSVTGEDVTQEYVDLQSRLKSLESTYDRLTQLLKLAKKASEALEISDAIDRVTERIEQAKGRMEYLRKSSRYSTIEVHLSSHVEVLPTPRTEQWALSNTAKQALAFSLNSLKSITAILIWLVVGFWYVVPVVLAWLVFRRPRKPSPAKT
ncbi:MAG: DUF4349 domain-containing protein [bacterium]